MSTEILIKEPFNAAVVFNDAAEAQKVIDVVRKLAVEALGVETADTAEGRAAIRSVAHKVTKSKTFVEAERKAYTADLVKKKRSVDSIGNTIWDGLEKVHAEIRKSLDDWEAKEKARIEGHDAAIAQMQALATLGPEPAPEAVRLALDKVAALRARIWEEFVNRAVEVANTVEGQLNSALAAAEKREKDAAELAALRAEQAARAEAAAAEAARAEQERVAAERREREATLAAEAAEAARKAAEAVAETQRKAAEEAAQRAIDEANERAAKAAQDAAAAEARAVEAAARAKREQEEAVAAAELRVAAQTAEIERRRKADEEQVERARAAIEAEDRRRQANVEHRSKVNKAAKAAISGLLHDGINEVMDCLTTEQTDAMAQAIVIAIVKGEIPNVTLAY